METIKNCIVSLIKQKIKEVDEQLIINTTEELKKKREKLFLILWEVEKC